MNKRKAGSDNDSGDAQADLLAEQKKEAKKTAKEKNARQKAKAAKDAKDAKDEKTRPPAVPDPIPAGGDPPSGDPAVNGNIQGRVPPSPKHVPAKPPGVPVPPEDPVEDDDNADDPAEKPQGIPDGGKDDDGSQYENSVNESRNHQSILDGEASDEDAEPRAGLGSSRAQKPDWRDDIALSAEDEDPKEAVSGDHQR